MKYYFDTEFLEDGSTIDLISIAFVAEDGREYYAVNDDMDLERIENDPWLMKNVMGQLPPYSTWKPKAQIALEVLDFLTADKKSPELWAGYCAYDHVAYAQLWGKMIDLPKGLPMYTNDVKSLLHWVLPKVQDRSGYPAQAEGLHDALADARHVKVRYDWIMERQDGTAKLVASLLESKRETMKLFGVAIDQAKEREDYMLVARIEIEKYRTQAEIDLLSYVVNG